jgi:hypothetical protein
MLEKVPILRHFKTDSVTNTLHKYKMCFRLGKMLYIQLGGGAVSVETGTN